MGACFLGIRFLWPRWAWVALTALPAAVAFGQEPITGISEVRALPRSETAKGLPVRLRGVVTLRGGETFVMQDETAGIYVNVSVARSRKIWESDDEVFAKVRVGSVVEIEGVTDRGGFSPPMLPRTLRIVGEATLPPAREMVPARFFGGAEDCQRITVRGVVQGSYRGSDNLIVLIMDANPGTFIASVPASAVPDPERLADAEVLLTGVPLAKFNTRGEFLMPNLSINEPADLVVEKPATSPPFESPKVLLMDVDGFRAEPLQAHRLQVEGTVTAVFRDPIFTIIYIQEGQTGVRVSVRGGASAAVGERLEVAGFVDRARTIRGLKEAVIRKIASAAVPEPTFMTPEGIMAVNAEAAGMGLIANLGDSDGRLIRFEARLVDKLGAEPGKSRLVLATESSSVLATLSNKDANALSDLSNGSQLAITGIVQLVYSPETFTGGPAAPIGMELLLRSRDDITVLAAPSWWTRTRVLYALAAVASALAVVGIWVWLLRQQVRAQAARFADAMETHRNTELEMKGAREERFRLAADLHDSLQQHLTGASYRMEAALMRLPAVPDAVREQFAAARAALERTRTGLRDCLLGLRHVEEGPAEFPALLRHAADKMEHWPKGAVEINTEGEPFALSRQVMGSLLLLMQEAVGNAFKHGAPTRVTIALHYTPESLMMRIEDDGSGFDPAQAPDATSGHFGLESMKHRLRWLGGKTEITSQPGAGALIVASLPRSRAESEMADAAEDDAPP